MGLAGPRPVVLDAGALIAFEKGDDRARRLVGKALAHAAALVVPLRIDPALEVEQL